jgi:NADH dehydrogenase
MKKKKIVVIGAGFAGLNAALPLAKDCYELTLIDKTNHHLFQPLLYQVATAALSPAEIGIPTRAIFRKHKNTYIIMANVVSIHKKERRVLLENGDEIPYDYLVIGVGARHSYFGKDKWEKFAPGLKTLDDALHIREQMLISFEKAERCEKKSEAQKYMNFVIIGGGPTGVEMAGAISEIAYKTMRRDFLRIDTKRTKIFLIEGHPEVLAPYPKSLRDRAMRDLKKMGVTLLTNQRVTNVTKNGVYLGKKFIEARNIIWAAGNAASPLLQTLDTPLNKAGQAIVEPDLSIPGHPEIFVVGDCASVTQKDGSPVPAVSPAAIQMGKYVSKIIKKDIPPHRRLPFSYFDKGMMATIGKFKAVAATGPFRFKGFSAWLAWAFVHIYYLIGFRAKLVVLAEWLFYLIKSSRNIRLVSRPMFDDKSKKARPLKKKTTYKKVVKEPAPKHPPTHP